MNITPTTTLDVYLGSTLAGSIEVSAGDNCVFRLDGGYRNLHPRPVLGQQFEDNLQRVHRSTLQLPPFFANLLPEGALRAMVARRLGVKEIREWYLLSYLGQDLPGAVRVQPREPVLDRLLGDIANTNPEPTSDANPSNGTDELGEPSLRFSLTGVQLKLSMLRSGRSLMLPARGQDGDWLVKFPDQRYARVPEVEYSVMQWAQKAGIETPVCELVEVDDIVQIPDEIREWLSPGMALAVRRFDRPKAGERVHQEDMAQVLGLYPSAKYDHYNYETIASIVLHTCGQEAFEDFIDRLVFVIMSGNGDAHHKNWSLRYPNGFSATLSPAYDQVATVLFIADDRLALNFAKSKKFSDISLDSFRRLGRKLRRDPDAIVARARRAVTRICDSWRTIASDMPLDAKQHDAIERHWRRVPLAAR